MLETLDYNIRIGSTPTFLYFDKYGLRWSYKNFLISQSTTYSYQAETLRNLCAKHSEDITRILHNSVSMDKQVHSIRYAMLA